jgi:hypothetical protein
VVKENRRLPKIAVPPVRLRIGIGTEDGYTNVKHIGAEEEGSVDAIYSAFHFHRLDRLGRYAFMNGAYRVLKPGAQLMLVMPHARSDRAICDPLAQWPPLCESSFMLYSKAWREQEKMMDLPLTCDFGGVYGYGHTPHPDLVNRNEMFAEHAKEHEYNWVLDLHVTLTKER